MLNIESLMHVLNIAYPHINFKIERKIERINIIVEDLDFFLSREFDIFLDSLSADLTMEEYMSLDFSPPDLSNK